SRILTRSTPARSCASRPSEADEEPMSEQSAAAPDRSPKGWWTLVKSAVAAWIDDYAPSMGAALSYYTVFSLAPLLLIVIGVAGLVFGADAARRAIVEQLQALGAPEGAAAIRGLLESAGQPGKSLLASIIGFVTVILGASSV